MLDRLSDLMAFGRLLPCTVCKDGQLVFNKFGYECKGDLTEWTKCAEVFKEPARSKFVVPKELAEEHSFLKKYKCVVGNRIIKDVKPTVVPKKEEDEVDSKYVFSYLVNLIICMTDVIYWYNFSDRKWNVNVHHSTIWNLYCLTSVIKRN